MEPLMKHLKNGKQLLPTLPLIEQLSPYVWRFLGGNPGSFTLSGTNTYLIGQGEERILFDTGSGVDIYSETLCEGMKQSGCTSISQIVISHWHHDHLGGVPQVMKIMRENGISPPPVRKFMPNYDPQTFGNGESAINPYTLWPKDQFVPLKDGEEIACCNVHLKFMHTPGHANDHIVAILKEENSMFTGDNVLGTGTSVFNDLHLYMNSLRLMLAKTPGRLYPGHGPIIEDGCKIISTYIEHRTKRITQVVRLLSKHSKTNGEQKCWTLAALTRAMYTELDEQLIPPAMRNTYQVLESLRVDGVVEKNGNDEWSAVMKLEVALKKIQEKTTFSVFSSSSSSKI